MQEKNIPREGIFYKPPVIELKVGILKIVICGELLFMFKCIFWNVHIFYIDPKLIESLTPKPEKWKSYIWYNFERKYSFCGVAKVASSTWRSHNRDLVGHLRFDAFLKVGKNCNKINNFIIPAIEYTYCNQNSMARGPKY